MLTLARVNKCCCPASIRVSYNHRFGRTPGPFRLAFRARAHVFLLLSKLRRRCIVRITGGAALIFD
jgi:hypothetical protein